MRAERLLCGPRLTGEKGRSLKAPFFKLALERWPSGLRRTPGKRVGVNAPPGFESPSLRHSPLPIMSRNNSLYLINRKI